jgi:BCD family chlorophyll transporter-like MFS transporter
MGLVQAAIGANVVLATSTLNRIMVVELAMPAVLPGVLVALHYLVQMLRPRFGHGSDVGGRLTRWIVGGMAVLALGAVAAAGSVVLMAVNWPAGVIAAVASYLVIGLGVGASGTSLLVLLAKRVDAPRRPAAATITWVMMIAGFVLTTAAAGQFLEPYSHRRLLVIAATVAVITLVVTALAVYGIEQPSEAAVARHAHAPQRARFLDALRQVWSESAARQFTIFVLISMLAYSGQELIFEPFAGSVFHFTPAQSARLTSLQHAGALIGMIAVALLATLAARTRVRSLRAWTIAGCAGSTLALLGLVASAQVGIGWPLRANAFALGLANGIFTVAAVASMMDFAAVGGPARQGIRMGLWGAAQAVAFALGGLCSSILVDVVRGVTRSPTAAYALVFAAQAALFLWAAALAAGMAPARSAQVRTAPLRLGAGEVSA